MLMLMLMLVFEGELEPLDFEGFLDGRSGPRRKNPLSAIAFRTASTNGAASEAEWPRKTTRNSSPPYRNTRPPPPTCESFEATILNTWSPVSCPYVSLNFLK